MTIVFFVLAVLLIMLSFKSFRGGIDYLRFVKAELARPRSTFTPFASVIVPCKGVDQGFEENLSALLDQDYPDHEVIFVVDDERDPAASMIEQIFRKRTEVAEKTPSGSGPLTKLVVAAKALDSAQKVENLREAVRHNVSESRVFVFADSDVRPAKGWLAALVAPLDDDSVGASTGYRWFVSNKPTFASELRSAWNASIASALGPNIRSNFCWGGSMAIRRDVFEKLDMCEEWRGTLSDDFTVTRAIKGAGLTVVFVPRALTASVESCSFRELLEFTTRQMKITRVYAPNLWKLSFFGSALFNVTLIWAVLIVIFTGPDMISYWIAAATIALVSIFSIGKSWLRLNAVRSILTDYSAELRKQFLPQNALWLLAPAVFLFNSVAAWLSRKMTWRGVQYELVSPTETRVLD